MNHRDIIYYVSYMHIYHYVHISCNIHHIHIYTYCPGPVNKAEGIISPNINTIVTDIKIAI